MFHVPRSQDAQVQALAQVGGGVMRLVRRVLDTL